ncbi:hypothetical protein ALC57_03061 [Trachymyrmex cornetzi]|uniref:Mos1 transposase HTH domain-containing protein n=1 Tax=Trachymyrmex cornetzi TaxID=471704 RepID=A0A151JMJ7_9HYME|nr:hypothetical protein ALC57_03061 [Trachymyrmex cornetzi]
MSEQEVHTSVEQRIIIKFLSREGVKPAEILHRLTAQFAEKTLSRTQVYDWHKKFSDGQESMQNETHTRRPRKRSCAIGYRRDQIHSLMTELKNFRFGGKNV